MMDNLELVRQLVADWYQTNTHVQDWDYNLSQLKHSEQEWIESHQIKATSILVDPREQMMFRDTSNGFYIPIIVGSKIRFRPIIFDFLDIGTVTDLDLIKCTFTENIVEFIVY
jgi:hypothetical protein